MRKIGLLLLMLLPSRIKIEILRLLGHQVSRKCRIGMSWLDIRSIRIDDGAWIGPMNAFKGLKCLELGREAGIGRFNQFTASQAGVEGLGEGAGVVRLADGAVITMRHYFDCSALVAIGERSLVAGIGTIFFTHQKGIKALYEAKPIRVGPRVYLGAACIVLPGAHIAGHAYVASGSLVGGALDQEYAVYSSPRAQVVKALAPDAAYFTADAPTARRGGKSNATITRFAVRKEELT